MCFTHLNLQSYKFLLIRNYYFSYFYYIVCKLVLSMCVILCLSYKHLYHVYGG